MFKVVNTRTGEVVESTTDVLRASIIVDKLNNLEIGVGYDPCYEVQITSGPYTFVVTDKH